MLGLGCLVEASFTNIHQYAVLAELFGFTFVEINVALMISF